MPSSVQLYNQAISDFKKIQTNLFEKQAKVGAESLADTFAELGNKINIVENFRFSSERSSKFMSSIDDVTRKLDTTYKSVDEMINTLIDFKSTLSLESSTSNSSVTNLTAAANAALDKIAGALNSKDGANYLFAGSNSNVEPVDDLKFNSNVVGGEITANYYNGDDLVLSVDASSSLTINYGVTANNPAFQKMIGAINMARSQEANGQSANYEAAGKYVDEALQELISLRADMGNNTKALEQMRDFHAKAKDSFDEKLSEANSPDIVQLTIETTQLQASLQASFQIFSRISSLALSNFIN